MDANVKCAPNEGIAAPPPPVGADVALRARAHDSGPERAAATPRVATATPGREATPEYVM
eukprot:scaffold51559_cov31-Tisochrysis_lutea.AAC.1